MHSVVPSNRYLDESKWWRIRCYTNLYDWLARTGIPDIPAGHAVQLSMLMTKQDMLEWEWWKIQRSGNFWVCFSRKTCQGVCGPVCLGVLASSPWRELLESLRPQTGWRWSRNTHLSWQHSLPHSRWLFLDSLTACSLPPPQDACASQQSQRPRSLSPVPAVIRSAGLTGELPARLWCHSCIPIMSSPQAAQIFILNIGNIPLLSCSKSSHGFSHTWNEMQSFHCGPWGAAESAFFYNLLSHHAADLVPLFLWQCHSGILPFLSGLEHTKAVLARGWLPLLLAGPGACFLLTHWLFAPH